MKRLVLAAALLLGACGDDSAGPSQEEQLAEQLSVLPGLHVLIADRWTDGRTRIIADLEQAVDHDDPASATFLQRIVIYHRDAAAPMVLSTQGYDLGDGFGPSEPTVLLDANEVQVEHRFFGASRPDPVDWSKLRIAQAAGDHHAVVVALSAFYSGRWLSTGASKGGVAALTHRRFYPDDVAGTVAYVAPYAQGLEDMRYADLVRDLGVGSCGAELRRFQEDVLTEPRRSQLVTSLDEAMTQRGYATSVLGVDRILEFTTVETPFTFWQYSGSASCAFIPDVATDSATEILAFIDATNRFALWSDQGIDGDQAYWIAVAREDGYPGDANAHIAALLRYADRPIPLQMITAIDAPVYDPAPMQDVRDWVATSATTTVLIYGARDPWSAGAFAVSGANDTSSHVVAGGNHGSRLGDLPPDEREAVVGRIRAWASP